MPDTENHSATLWKIVAEITREANGRDAKLAKLEALSPTEDERKVLALLCAVYTQRRALDLFTSEEMQRLRERMGVDLLALQKWVDIFKEFNFSKAEYASLRRAIDLVNDHGDDLEDMVMTWQAQGQSRRRWHEYMIQKLAENAVSLLILIPASTALLLFIEKVLLR